MGLTYHRQQRKLRLTTLADRGARDQLLAAESYTIRNLADTSLSTMRVGVAEVTWVADSLHFCNVISTKCRDQQSRLLPSKPTGITTLLIRLTIVGGPRRM
jgi:hypothetical protein